jgi:hypothetical protein
MVRLIIYLLGAISGIVVVVVAWDLFYKIFVPSKVDFLDLILMLVIGVPMGAILGVVVTSKVLRKFFQSLPPL